MHASLSSLLGVKVPEYRSLAWFGLAADPPTLAHRAVVDAVMGSGLVEAVVVFPAGDLPYKQFLTSDQQRLDMLELWKADAEFGKEVMISSFDIKLENAMLWFDLWKLISSLRPEVKHYLVIGTDQYTEIRKSWVKGKELWSEANLMVVPREGYELEGEMPAHHILLKVPAISGSSTEVRGGDVSGVDDRVKRYILEEGLYQ